ncbi:MAG: PEPxxWA-CTERM sorting domain-containing protein [Proteobacteria bacterium]|nr:PEPxxWA-CTERM sorting domain-containing protein [Pseudomonadota bacterium]
MKLRLLALAATAAATALTASAASAAVVSVNAVAGVNLTQPLITDFNPGDLASGYTFTQDALAFVRDGALGLESGVSAPPPADMNGPVGSFYETVEGGGSATLTSEKGLSNFQFYMGSPDDYNTVTFTFVDSSINPITLSGAAIWGGAPAGNGDQSQGFTVSYAFSSQVKSVNFASSANSFEFDKLAGAVPEPASWALMILGFGGAGAALRGQRRRQAVAAAA